MNITPQDILLSALLATVHAVTEEAYDAIAEALEILREALSTPNLRVPSNTFNWPLIGSELDGRIGAIHIGSCRGSGRIDPDAEAHAHIDGSAEICIFQMPESRAQMEWLIAHETAHLIAEREAQHHGQAWQAQVARLGYPEEIEPNIDTHMEMFKPAAAESRSTLFASVADIVMTECERNPPTLWRLVKHETQITARRHGLLPQRT